MSQQYPPQPPPAGWTPQPQHAAPTAAPKKARRWPWIVAIVASLGIGYGVGAASGSTPETSAVANPTPAATSERPAPTSDAPEPVSEAPPPPPEPPAYTPVAKDFQLKVKVLSKECFGSAGCNVTFRILVTYLGKQTPDPDKTFEVIYDVKGGEDTYTNTLSVTGDESSVDKEEFISTKDEDDKITAVVTDVL